MKYIYYRAFSFYEKNGLAIVPHTYAAGIPTLIQGFSIYFLYYLLVYYDILNLIRANVMVYGITMLGVYYLNDRFFNKKIKFYKKKWINESKEHKVTKGILITLLAIGSFVGILLIANALHELDKK